MSIKSIRTNYVKLLESLKDAGMTLEGSQKETLDGFLESIESTISKTRDDAIRMTKRIVEEKMEDEYRKVFESILSHTKEHETISEGIQTRIQESKDMQPLIEGIDKYLTDYVKEILPKKEIVDYDRLQKLEKLNESLREMFQVNQMDIDEKAKETRETLVRENQELKKIVEKTENELSQCKERLQETADLDKEISEITEGNANGNEETSATEPTVEKAENVEGKSVPEKTVPTNVTDDDKDNETVDTPKETNLEEAIQKILGETGSTSEKAENTKETISGKDENGQEISPVETHSEDETLEESYDFDSACVTEDMMQTWIDAINRTTP